MAEFPKTTVKKSRVHGKGLFAGEDIAAGAPIIEYGGERITRAEARRRGHEHVLAIDARNAIDGTVDGTDARFANHSCEPNAEWMLYKKRAFLIANRAIAKGAEITWDYALEVSGKVDAITAMLATTCSCGAKGCRGTMLRE